MTAAAAVVSAAGCGRGRGAPTSSGLRPARTADAGAEADGSAPGTTAPDAEAEGAEAGGPEADAGAPTQSLVRVANFTAGAPAAGYDVCLAPAGTTSWMGPMLSTAFPAGSLGANGSGVTFPSVTQYFPVPPGTYDLQLVAAGSGCDQGVIAVTNGLPTLAVGSRTTFATVGDAQPTGNDAALKVLAFQDEQSAGAEGAALRIINAIPSMGYVDVGTGSLASNTFSPLAVYVAFGTAGTRLADGGAPDGDGYALVAPWSGVELSAHPSGTTTDAVTGSNVSLAAGSATTMVLVGGGNGIAPPQFLACTDSAPVQGALSACSLVAR